jgi:hypothetical protein
VHDAVHTIFFDAASHCDAWQHSAGMQSASVEHASGPGLRLVEPHAKKRTEPEVIMSSIKKAFMHRG